MTRFILDSGNPDEYREAIALAQQHNVEIWGATTNPSLIAKKLAGEKVSQKEAFELQKNIALEILDLVPGAVSVEVYVDETTPAYTMVEQGSEISSWDNRIVVKIPTTIEGFKTRTELRKTHIPVNNTLVFSQEQIYAICLHEHICQQTFGPIDNLYPPFISPFVGRLDDIGENGMMLVENGMKIKSLFDESLWMLEASVRKIEHLKIGLDLEAELITAPLKVYEEWFALSENEKQSLDTKMYAKDLRATDSFQPSEGIRNIATLTAFMQAIGTNQLNVQHELTTKGIKRFATDWKSVIVA